MKHYDYIICGGGVAGLSLAYYLKNSKLTGKSVLLVEPQDKNKNDRTLAFWEEGKGTFEDILFRKWNVLKMVDTKGNPIMLDLENYQYKLLWAKDFYAFTIAELKNYKNLVWLKDSVTEIKEHANHAVVTTRGGEKFSADIVFDSAYPLDLTLKYNHNLLQHFVGYLIKTGSPVFNPDVPEMMNFNVEQKGDCRFMYILPFDTHTALIEYTIFSETLLAREEYENELRKYIREQLQLSEYSILEEETGVIPMSDVATEEYPSAHVVRIGMAGGYTNPSTGYTFTNTQRKLKKIIEKLEETGSARVRENIFKARFRLYSSVLLNVLEQKRHSAADIFIRLYTRNRPVVVFRYLDGDTNLWEELKLMNTVPRIKFLAAIVAVMARKVMRWLSGQPRPSPHQ